jgi:hypothetical protein
MLDEHVTEALGRARDVAKNSEVVEVREPLIASCPLASSVRSARKGFLK